MAKLAQPVLTHSVSANRHLAPKQAEATRSPMIGIEVVQVARCLPNCPLALCRSTKASGKLIFMVFKQAFKFGDQVRIYKVDRT